jgi:hypothetical protein
MDFKEGDIVVCIKKPALQNSIFGIQLNLYQKYKVVSVYVKTISISDIISDDDNKFIPVQNFKKKYFISENEFRKMKIKKILHG